MRILVATHQWFPDYIGGSARVAAESVRAFASRGHDVTVLAPSSPCEPIEERDRNVRVKRVLTRGTLPRTATDVTSTGRYARRFRGSHFDVLVAHHPTTAVGLISARLDAPLVFVYHASVVRELRMLRRSIPLGPRRLAALTLDPALTFLERLAVGRARRVLVLSEYNASLLASDHPRARPRTRVTPGGVDLEAFAPRPDRGELRRSLGLSEEGALVLSVRRLEPCLGLETLVRAVASIDSAHQPALAIAGDGSLAGELRRLGNHLGLGPRLRLLGVPPPAELGALYGAADLFVMSPAPHEGFGMATLEALASGTPAVGAPLGAIPEILRPLSPRLVAANGSVDALASTIQLSLEASDPNFRRSCREYAAARYGWDTVANSWEDALAEASRHYGGGAQQHPT